jgi:hypothetical protein
MITERRSVRARKGYNLRVVLSSQAGAGNRSYRPDKRPTTDTKSVISQYPSFA